MTDSKVSRKAPKKPEVDKTSSASEAPLIQVAPLSAPKPARKRAPAVAKVVMSEEAKVAPAASVAKQTPAKQAPRVAKPVVDQAPQEAKPPKAKKAKLVRDSFTMPESEYAAIATLKKRCLNLGVAAKKSEILRAAIFTLAQLSDLDVAAAIEGLDAIKTGRPAKGAK
jgi:hypothetical protein